MAEKIRGFDTPQLYRKDALIRIEYMERDIQERAKRIKELEKAVGYIPRRKVPEDENGD
jgi:hypothetical protein